jgi:DNA-binding response OmpR family regulator
MFGTCAFARFPVARWHVGCPCEKSGVKGEGARRSPDPLWEARTRRKRRPTAMRIPAPHLRPSILIVDDDPAVGEALTAALADHYRVHTASSGEEACACLRTHPVVAIILDAILRDEHGLDLVERFRTIHAAPIVLLTGHSSEELAIRALWSHVAGYLKKPPSLRELRGALDGVLPREMGPSHLAARARQALDAYPPKPFRAADLAHQLGVGEAHLRRVFRAAYGKTPRRYLAEIRLQRARALLCTTDRGVKEVADAVGFTNGLALRRGFRRLLGGTPHESRWESAEPSAAD